jgi:hypothetical protein
VKTAVLMVIGSLLSAAAPAAALSPSDAISRINALRAAHGIPALVEDGNADAGCQAHAHYAALNGGFDRGAPHGENPGKPGYTDVGASWGNAAVLASGGWRDPNPWWTAPAHLAQVLSPWLVTTGYGEDHGYLCLATLAGAGRPMPQDSILTFPGPNTSGVPPSETAGELNASGQSFTPGNAAGIPNGAATGPYLMVFTGGYGETDPRPAPIDAVSLTGPAGPVDIAVVDNTFIIPRQPLAPLTTYTASVTVTFAHDSCLTVSSPIPQTSGIPTCPADVPTFCTTDPQQVAVGIRMCDPGEQPLTFYVFPPRMITHAWSFTTGAATSTPKTPAATCRMRVGLVTRRVRAPGRLLVSYRTCATATVRATLSRSTSVRRGRRPTARSRVVARAKTHTSRGRTGHVMLTLRSLRPGRYVVQAQITAGGLVLFSRRIAVTVRR